MAEQLTPEQLKEKLVRALRAKAVLAERSKRLQQQADDFRHREGATDHVTSELLERQRELNYMLHRASSVLHQLQDTNLALSAEFTQLVKELPAPKEGDLDDTIARVNELFKKTHELAGDMQDEIFHKAAEPDTPSPRDDQATPASAATASPVTSDRQTEAPDPQPLQQDRFEPETEEIAQAETQAVHEASFETEAEDTERGKTHESAPGDPERQERIEQLFRDLRCDEFGRTKGRLDDKAPDAARKPGLFSRLFGRREPDAGTEPSGDADE